MQVPVPPQTWWSSPPLSKESQVEARVEIVLQSLVSFAAPWDTPYIPHPIMEKEIMVELGSKPCPGEGCPCAYRVSHLGLRDCLGVVHSPCGSRGWHCAPELRELCRSSGESPHSSSPWKIRSL